MDIVYLKDIKPEDEVGGKGKWTNNKLDTK